MYNFRKTAECPVTRGVPVHWWGLHLRPGGTYAKDRVGPGVTNGTIHQGSDRLPTKSDVSTYKGGPDTHACFTSWFPAIPQPLFDPVPPYKLCEQ